MKKMSSQLLLYVVVIGIGIAITLSGPASALIMTIGDPYNANSWHQRIRISHSDRFDNLVMSIGSGGSFKNESSYNNSSWRVSSFSSNRQSFSGNSVSDLVMEIVFKDKIPEHFGFSITSLLGNALKESKQCTLDSGTWSTSVPEADIMWLLGPAFIMLGLLGRKKVKKYSHS